MLLNSGAEKCLSYHKYFWLNYSYENQWTKLSFGYASFKLASKGIKACVFVLLICFQVLQRAFPLPQELVKRLSIHASPGRGMGHTLVSWQCQFCSIDWVFQHPQQSGVLARLASGLLPSAAGLNWCSWLGGSPPGPGWWVSLSCSRWLVSKESTTKRESFEIAVEFVTEFFSTSLLSPNCGC